jgi:hypothetical protein
MKNLSLACDKLLRKPRAIECKQGGELRASYEVFVNSPARVSLQRRNFNSRTVHG